MSSPAQLRFEKKPALTRRPHLHAGHSSRKILWGIALTLIPLWILRFVFLGWGAIQIFIIALSATAASEYAFRAALGLKPQLRDGSSVLSGMLLGLLFSVSTPWWMVALAAFIGIILGKEIFGGLGENLFHPALVGFASVWALFPNEIIFASSLDGFRAYAAGAAIIGAGMVMAFKRWIDWRSPLTYLILVAASAFVLGEEMPGFILNSGVLLGAFFFAADRLTAPVSKQARIIYVLLCVTFMMILRSWAQVTVAVAMSTLFMNALTPLLDRWVRPRAWWA